MNPESKPSENKMPVQILVAGDVCLDVVAVPMPPQATQPQAENWRLTGETRTHFLPGGAMLLAEWVRAAVGSGGSCAVVGPQPMRPEGVSEGQSGPLVTQAFLGIAPRLRRQEVIHSLLRLKCFPTMPKAKKEDVTLRVETEAGFTGPDQDEPTLEIRYPATTAASIIILDDTGNRVRRVTQRNPWPAAIISPPKNAAEKPLIIYKLHRPLPGAGAANPLWDEVEKQYPDRRLVIISVDDLRAAGAPISEGLSWERTALDVVWQLLNTASFEPLRKCPWLVIRLGLDGAILWRHVAEESPDKHSDQAWLVYDPAGIEGSFARSVPGRMVGTGSVFTAALAKLVSEQNALAENNLIDGLKAGLVASRRLLVRGYGPDVLKPAYPAGELFTPGKEETAFACQPVPIIPGALSPDRGSWRLLDQIFGGKTSLLHRAVMQLASNSKPPKADDKSEGAEREREASELLKQAPLGVFGNLRTHDRREMENYRSLHTLLRDYLLTAAVPRPLSFAVFGPPGAGKSFGVKEVAASLKDQPGCREVKDLAFNLSLYQTPEELAGAFHLVRDIVLEGKVPLVFFDEFDTALDGEPLGWLSHFLAPMQDGKFLDRGAPHPIGQAIFVFAGGTCDSFREFKAHPGLERAKFKQRKGPDFLSRLRATLDIPSLNLLTACCPLPDREHLKKPPIQPPGTFDPFGPIESLPCEAAILLRRAAILSFNLKAKAPGLVRADESLAVDRAVLRALLFLPAFEHGNRSLEAMMDMSHLADIKDFSPSLLPAAFQIPLHADAAHFGQLVGTALPYTDEDRQKIAEEIHNHFREQRKAKHEFIDTKPSHQEWKVLSPKYRDSNAEQADDIPRKLLLLGLWLRKIQQQTKTVAPRILPPLPVAEDEIENAARREHDRWIAYQRSQGFIYGLLDDSVLRTHPCLVPWEDSRLTDPEKDKDRDAIRAIPRYLDAGGYEVIKPLDY